MATWDDIHAAAVRLPSAWENKMPGWAAFQVGRKGFVHASRSPIIMKLDRNYQELLFDARPDVLLHGRGPALELGGDEALDSGEVAELVCEALRQVIPNKVGRPYFPPYVSKL